MRLLEWAADGGKDSGVRAFVIVEIKCLFSIMVLFFPQGTREKFHSHAFNAVTWWLRGYVWEERLFTSVRRYSASWRPKFTSYDNAHRVCGGVDGAVALTFRGQWRDTWYEYDTVKRFRYTLTHGRQVLAKERLDVP